MEIGEDAWQWQTKEMVWSAVAIAMSCLVLTIWEVLWWKPQRIRSAFKKQGIDGPIPSFLSGNLSEVQRMQSQYSKLTSPTSTSFSDQWFCSLFPYLQQWRKQYGPTYLYSIGNRLHLYVGDPETIKELNLTRSLDLGKPSYLTKPLKPMLGDGIIRANGQHWSFQRNLIAPQFFLSKIQKMVDYMEESTKEIIRKWERIIIENGGKVAEIVIDDDLKALTADVISKASFSSSYAQGNQIFSKLAALQAVLAKPNLLFGFLNLRFFPTKENREIWRLEQEVEKLILKVVSDRKLENQRYGNENQKDLLQLIIDSSANAKNQSGSGIMKKLRHKHETKKLIVDMCKNIYFAGSESTAVLVTWTLVLLAFHPEWQDRLRSEISNTFSDMSPHCFRDAGITTSREALEEMKLGELVVPKGTNIWILTPAMHRDKEIVWTRKSNLCRPTLCIDRSEDCAESSSVQLLLLHFA